MHRIKFRQVSCWARPTRWHGPGEAARVHQTRLVPAVARLGHDLSNNRLKNLRSFYRRRHLIHDRPRHLARRRATYSLHHALGDVFLGPKIAKRRPALAHFRMTVEE